MQDKLFASIEKFKLPIALSVLGLVLIIGGIFASPLTKSGSSRTKEFPKESLVDAAKMLSVDISGAVKKPGVYQLKDGSRIEEAIKAAGGFSDTANTEYISKYLNLAQKLSDGSKVYVPIEGEAITGSSGSISQAGTVAGIISKVNINSASQAEIEALPGIGPVTAAKIISGRPYQTVDELSSKKVVSKAVFEKIKEQIVVY